MILCLGMLNFRVQVPCWLGKRFQLAEIKAHYLFLGLLPLQRGQKDKRKELTNQLQFKICLYTAAPVHHADCHSKINSLCTLGNYSSHLGVIYLLYNMSRAICFVVAKVQLKLLQVPGFQEWHNVCQHLSYEIWIIRWEGNTSFYGCQFAFVPSSRAPCPIVVLGVYTTLLKAAPNASHKLSH